MKFRDKLFDKVYGCLVGGTIGDAIGGPTEMMHYKTIKRLFGRVTDMMDYGPACLFGHAGLPAGHCTDDSLLKLILCDAIIHCQGRITAEDWGESWRRNFNPDPTVFYVSPLNSYFRLVNDDLPAREVGRGNMQANGSAMCIAPIGIINACDSYQAAYDTYEVASLLHTGLAREAAAAVSAAVAEAFKPDATIESVLEASMTFLTPRSGAREVLEPMLDLAKKSTNPEDYTYKFYEDFIQPSPYSKHPTDLIPEGYMETVNALETVGAALGIFYVSKGEAIETLLTTANFGLDCDTIGAISGSIVGAYKGGSAFPKKWCDLVDQVNSLEHLTVAEKMYTALLAHKRKLEIQVNSLDNLIFP
jgi:ADP-ribosylglycohydrolase